MKRTSHNYCTYEEEKKYLNEFKDFKKEFYNETGRFYGSKGVAESLLDSSLISADNKKIYDIKLVQCGNYIQVYYYDHKKIKIDSNLEQISSKKILINELHKYKPDKKEPKLKQIEEKNLIRSKLNCQRIIKANENDFKTFITLTFKSDVITINQSNKRFKSFKDSILKIISRLNNKYNSNYEFKYICVPEFQKNGRVHYHLLTNIDFNDSNFINENINLIKLKERLKKNKFYIFKLTKFKKCECSREDIKLNDFDVCIRKNDNLKKTYNFKSKSVKYFKTLKYWNNGYSNIVSIDNINIVGYLLKYMTKDIDNRLFGRRRYFYSLNLHTPDEIYLNITDNTQDILLWLSRLNNSKITYDNIYYDKLGQEINFKEYKIE